LLGQARCGEKRKILENTSWKDVSQKQAQILFNRVRTFAQLRRMLATHEGLKRKIEEMEKRYDENFRIVFEAIRQLFDEEEKPRPKIGYIKEKTKPYGKPMTSKDNKK
jgi:uncharacterized protein Yka (UPF0111/DUF47 family)